MAQSTSTQHDYSAIDPLSPTSEQVASPTHARQPFRRQSSSSWVQPSARYYQVEPIDQDLAEHEDTDYDQERAGAYGLGLKNLPTSIKRKPITSPEPLDSNGRISQATTAQSSANLGAANIDGTKWTSPTPQSSRYSLPESTYKHVPDNTRLVSREQFSGPAQGCPTEGDLLKTEWSWFTMLILFLAVFSWIFSAIFLGLGIARPRWGHRIGTQGRLSYDAATLLSALVSKLVELTFATTFVATLGQILSRRAFASAKAKPGKQGISLAEMNMRLWIMQPGTLITHWAGARYVITSVLGIVALAAAFSAAFYTTAAEALVSPKLKFGNNETLRLHGQVSALYANVWWLKYTCNTPTTAMDPDYAGESCLQVDLAGNGYRNYGSWMSQWAQVQSGNETLSDANSAPRPPPTAVLYDNTTVSGKWIRPSGENITADSAHWNRLVQNATVVMPHMNVLNAARYSKNAILQPGDLRGAGEYYLKAAVSSPGVNALCVGIDEDEVLPLIGNGTEFSTSNHTNISTPVDAIFKWSQDPDLITTLPHPFFPKLPKEYNTVANYTVGYGVAPVYMLGKPPNTTSSGYILCSLQSFQYSMCSTSLFVAAAGSDLSVHCESADSTDPEMWKSYNETVDLTKNSTDLPIPMVTVSKDWKDLGVQFLRAVGITSGIHDGDNSAERLLTQFTPQFTKATDILPDPNMPSIAEALCVLASYTILLSSSNSPFVHYWDYAHTVEGEGRLYEPADVDFLAILSYKDYASGGDQPWKGVFYIILAAVFILNTFCLIVLIYYFFRYGEVTDYTEPQNLFALAINSPPSSMLAGACGGGPTPQMLGRKWCVDMSVPEQDEGTGDGHGHGHTHNTPHFFVRYPEEEPLLASGHNTPALDSHRLSGMLSPKSPKRRHRSKPPSMMSLRQSATFEVDESPAVQQYMKLVGRS